MATKGFLVGDHSIRPRRAVRYVANKQASKTAKRKKKKPEWDNTVNDLTVHRASKEEQLKRHELHKSKNTTKVLFQRQLRDSSLDSTLQTPDSVERRKLTIVQEVLHGHDKLQDVLTESDKAMSVVKDLFGDDPKKYMGFPNITAAPSHVLSGKENRFPVAEPPETPTHLSMLSDSVMRTPALNELSDDNKEDDEMASGTPNSHEMHQARSYFQPKLDLQRFQQYVAEEQSRYMEQPQQPHLNGGGHEHVALKEQGSDHLALYGRGNDHVTGYDSMLPGSAQDKPDLYLHASQPNFYQQGAVTTVGTITNDQASGAFITGHGTDHVSPHGSVASRTDHASQPAPFFSQESVEIIAGSGPSVGNPVSTVESTTSNSFPPKTRPSSSHTEITKQRSSKIEKAAPCTVSHKPALNSSASAGATTLRSLDDLKKMVEQLENEIAAYEIETGRPPTHVSTSSGSGSFSGYTASLVTAVTKLMSYLKESEIQRKAEMIMREQVLQGFEEQRVLVDALTNDILHTQEQNLALQQELLEYRKTTDEQLQYLKRELFAVLKSHEYQELSSSINTLYSLNPVALKQGALDEASKNHKLEYLPRVPMSWAQNTTQQPNMNGTVTLQGSSQGHNQPQYSHIDTMKQPSLIPLADSQGSHSLLQQVNQSQNHHLPVQSNVQVTTGNANDQQRFITPMSVPAHELPHNGHSSLIYNNSVPPSAMHYGATSNNQLSSNIVMYPPSQAPLFVPQMSIASAPGKKPSVLPVRNQSTHDSGVAVHLATSPVPLVRDESTSLISRSEGVGTAASGRSEPTQFGGMETSTVSQPKQESVPTSSTAGVSGMSTALPLGNKPVHITTVVTSTAPLFSSYQHLPGQSVSSALLQTQVGKAVSRSLETTQPSSISQGVRPGTTASEAVPHAAASGPGHTVQAVTIPPVKMSHALYQHQHQSSRQNDAEPSARPQHPLKPNSFAPFSRTMAGSLPAGHQLRQRLQNLANRQKSLAVKSDQNVGSLVPIGQGKGETREVQQPRPSSPHVHFKEPPVAGEGHDTAKEHERKSPMVSPIPHKSAVAAQRSIVPSDNRVVVNLPNAWSDVSSTISL